MDNKNKNLDTLHKRWTWRKPKGKPKRPLSAYNIFFADVRRQLMSARKDANGIGFKNLAQAVAAKWRDLDPLLKIPYTEKAKLATERYKVELSLWELSQKDSTDNVAIPGVEVTPSKDYKSPSASNFASSSNCYFYNSNETIPNNHLVQQSHLNGIKIKEGQSLHPCQFNTGNQTEEIFQGHSLVDARNGVPSYYDNRPAQATSFQSPGTATACVTPSLHGRSIFAINETRSNIFSDDTYEPLPLTSTVDFFSDGYSLLAEESNIFNYRNSDMLQQSVADTNGSVIVSDYTGPFNGVTNNVCHSAPHTHAILSYNNDAPTQKAWNSIQLEILLKAMETDDWDFFAR